jgi:hypothetical protein
MNPRINQLVRSLLQRESIDQCSLPELEQYAERHPHFGAAQLLLTKKLQSEDPERYNEQVQKTYLFFHNPLWVEHLLSEQSSDVLITPAAAEPPSEHQAGTQATVSTPAPEAASSDPVVQDTPVSAEQSASDLLFEPYHTVDYFASQGIRFKDEERPADPLGRQLKSFTDWLKTLKRLPVTEIATQPVSSGEKKVEVMAAHSLEDREVLTEAMAEVWEKQGNHTKAIEIYSKLSLLEPAKNAYFAAKIEALKKSD